MIRLSGFLGSTVVTIAGHELGSVHDLRLVQRGRPVGSFGASLRIDSLLVGTGSLGARLGYGQGHVGAPWALAAIFGRKRASEIVDWRRVRAVENDRVIVDEAQPPPREAAGRTLDSAYALLDRQIVDRHGLMAGKVDDLVLRFAEDGDGPLVVAIVSGRGALANRYGRLGHRFARVLERLQDEDQSSEISFGVVRDVVPEVLVTLDREDLVTMRSEKWIRDHFIARLPGS